MLTDFIDPFDQQAPVNVSMVEGNLRVKDQLAEYIDRGDALENWSYLDFFLGTYDGKCLPERTSARGRPASTRVPYRPGSGRDGCCRIVRASDHETMPYFPGPWFPKRDPDNENGLFEACMLTLLKPWRSLGSIKPEHDSFRSALDSFLSTSPSHVHKTIQNIEFFHECCDRADARRATNEEINNSTIYESMDAEVMVESADRDHTADMADSPLVDTFEDVITEEDIIRAFDRPFCASELLYADTAVNVGRNTGALQDDIVDLPHKIPAANATPEQVDQFRVWESVLHTGEGDTGEEDVETMNDSVENIATTSQLNEPAAFNIECTHQIQHNTDQPVLNTRQRIVHDIVTTHLHSFMRGDNPPQRLMIVHGQGGTGKSALLNAISTSFEKENASAMLAKTAMSGVAASIVGGQTLHSWAALPVQPPTTDSWLTHPNKRIGKRRQDNIGNVLWLTVDEKSMLTTPNLHLLSKTMGVVRSGLETIHPTLPFGGVNTILLGDFHQFPPIRSKRNALYYAAHEKDNARLGRSLYEQFDIVIKLEEQMRVRDQVWQDILRRSRTGDCTGEDIAEIRKLILTNPQCEVPNFSESPWDDAVLVTPRNGVRTFWNEQMLDSHCRKTGEVHYIFYARDRYKDRVLSQQERLTVAHMKLEQTANLPNKVDLAVGMKTMVLQNIATHADLANGSRGIITDIILHPDESAVPDAHNKVYLQHPPAAVLFFPHTGSKVQIPGLPKGVIPIFPSHNTFTLEGRRRITVHRQQLPITAAYAFTDYKAQGQTMECIIVDLAKPPSGAFTGFAVYVALSRSRGRPTIRLLRDFDENLFTEHPSEELRREDIRLSMLEKKTLERFNNGELHHFST